MKTICLVCACLLPMLWPTAALAKRAPASQLLPDNTLVYARIADVPALIEKLPETSLGRMLQDAQLRPMFNDLFAELQERLAEFQKASGLSLEDLLRIPQGEIALAVLPSDNPRQPRFALLCDTGKNSASARKLVDYIDASLVAQGATRTEEQIGDTKAVACVLPGRVPVNIAWFERDGTVVFCTDMETAKELHSNWSGRSKDALADNIHFDTLVQSCSATAPDAAQLLGYINPMALVHQYTQGNLAAAAVVGLFPKLGLDGLQAVGGSVAVCTDDYDTLMQVHLLLDTPRKGVLEVPALGSGNFTPPDWVSDKVASYTSIHWNFQESFIKLEAIIDDLQGEGATAEQSRRIFLDRLGVDFIKDVLPQLNGRVHYIRQVMSPIDQRDPATLIAFELKDIPAAKTLLEKTVERKSSDLTPVTSGSKTLYAIKNSYRDDPEFAARMPEPCFALAHGCLIVSDRVALLKPLLGESDRKAALANSLEYKLIASKMPRLLNKQKPGLFTFTRTEESIRSIYDRMALSEADRRANPDAPRGGRFGREFGNVMEKHPLPPFAAFAKYFAPGGSAITSDDSGFHYVSFSLRRKQKSPN